eukprot:TRINITY_DN25957_c0_g1_i3.p4 TRINITY_DN25957_c0_g1~~TRINITY_DN25957_c0_g1_i3.p4  ORF type:complete len:100 (-),score=12.76 TRINITY_DN25957_c0_g1_i3:261-560(-)
MQSMYGTCIQGSVLLLEREKKIRVKLNKIARAKALKYYSPNKVFYAVMSVEKVPGESLPLSDVSAHQLQAVAEAQKPVSKERHQAQSKIWFKPNTQLSR